MCTHNILFQEEGRKISTVFDGKKTSYQELCLSDLDFHGLHVPKTSFLILLL